MGTLDKEAMNDITDELRAKFLRNRGYVKFPRPQDRQLQKKVDAMTDSELVDWAIENNYCPAYWKEHEQGDPPVSENGLVFVKEGDRNRIDECIKQRQQRS